MKKIYFLLVLSFIIIFIQNSFAQSLTYIPNIPKPISNHLLKFNSSIKKQFFSKNIYLPYLNTKWKWTELSQGLEYSLYLASKKGNFKKVQKYINKGANINCLVNDYNSLSISPLMVAIYKNNIHMVQYLISLGADVNLSNSEGASPLMVAAWVGNFEIIQILLNHHPNVNQISNIGSTAKTLELGSKNINYKKNIDQYIDLYFFRLQQKESFLDILIERKSSYFELINLISNPILISLIESQTIDLFRNKALLLNNKKAIDLVKKLEDNFFNKNYNSLKNEKLNTIYETD
jgi:ankyrin repeat protein